MIKNNNNLFLILMIMLCSFDFPIRTSGQQPSNAELALAAIWIGPRAARVVGKIYLQQCTNEDLTRKVQPWLNDKRTITIEQALEFCRSKDNVYEEMYQDVRSRLGRNSNSSWITRFFCCFN
ncbi:MAG: hypothetical protein ACXWL5_03400 [Candidatus Chromulinivorax sp.]